MGRCLKLIGVFAFCGAILHAVTAGYTRNPPFSYPGPNGAPSGFAVDVLNEAAQREGIRLDWELAEQSVPPTSQIDLWPAGVSTDERRRRFHITSPWWRTELIVVTRPEVDSLEQLSGTKVTATRDLQGVVRSFLPSATVEPSVTHLASAVSLCQNSVDAFVADRIILDQLLLDRPAACTGVRLHLLGLPGATLDLSILAVPAAHDVAERLRDQIGSMQADGRVAAIAMKYPAISAASSYYMTSSMKTEHRQNVLRLILILVSALLAVTGGLLFRMYRDVQRRKRTEQELRETNSDLQQFSYAASHDLSEPIRNMVLFSEVLQRRYAERLDQDGQKFLSVIRDSGHRMQQLLDSLREYTELSRPVSAVREIESREVLEHALTDLHDRITQSGAVITFDAMPRVCFQEPRLLQVFGNLISNALKYSGEATPRIHVSARKDGNKWEFCVRDEGIGIATEYQDRIFGVFKRLHGSNVAGSGIGLAICKRIVERAGGRMWVESEIGTGAKFFFTIRAGAEIAGPPP
jgi:signal transduction histidine kinase